MNFLKYGFLAVMVGMFMVACSDDDKTPIEEEEDLVGVVIMAETAKYDGTSIVGLDGVVYDIVQNNAQDAGLMADYAWYTLEYTQTPEVGLGINVNLAAIEYDQVKAIIDIEDAENTNDGVDVSQVSIEGDIITLVLDYVGGKKAHTAELIYDVANYNEEEGTLVLSFSYNLNSDKGTQTFSSVAQFSLATLEAEIEAGTSLIIAYTDIDGEEKEIETEFEF
nr:NigD-like C-terminal domain-containing protein [uncultured Carboxylicivirga sp.]